MEVSGQLHALIALSLGSKSQAPTEKETGWNLSRPGIFWKWKNILLPRGIKRPIHIRPARSQLPYPLRYPTLVDILNILIFYVFIFVSILGTVQLSLLRSCR